MMILPGTTLVRMFDGSARRVDSLGVGDELYSPTFGDAQVGCPLARVAAIRADSELLFEVQPLWSDAFVCGGNTDLVTLSVADWWSTSVDASTDEDVITLTNNAVEPPIWPWRWEFRWSKHYDSGWAYARIGYHNRHRRTSVEIPWLAGEFPKYVADWSRAIRHTFLAEIGIPAPRAQYVTAGERLREEILNGYTTYTVDQRAALLEGVMNRYARRVTNGLDAPWRATDIHRGGQGLLCKANTKWTHYYVLTLPLDVIGIVKQLAQSLALVTWDHPHTANAFCIHTGPCSSFFYQERLERSEYSRSYFEPIKVTVLGRGACYKITLDTFKATILLANGICIRTSDDTA